ncbi:MAG: sulfatase-like hydrolase/transferase [Salinivirgaceae bacterium]|nr:sulfatase-like hydrolase/transferase [Salinivirgaceae bacterium]
MFHGYSMNDIIKEKPEIKNELNGFVWYPNTLSVSTITSSSISAILGGHNYTPDKLNLDSTRTIREKITEVTENFKNKIQDKGYHFTSTSMIYSTIDKNLYDTYLPKWHKNWDQWNKKLNIGYSSEIGYKILWENALFYSAPLFVKAKIYNKGNWFHGNIPINDNTNKAKPYNFLRLLPLISNTNNDKPNFIYIHSMASHHPWDLIDDKGNMHSNVSPYENNKWVLNTLIKWIDWMKENDVYDNTKIVILSDHGPHWSFHEGGIDIDVPLIKNSSLKIWEGLALCMNPLMLVKDFNSLDTLKLDWRFMSNADAYGIVFNENDITKKPPIKDRILISTHPKWVTKIGEEYKFQVLYSYSVKNNYFDMNNWTPIFEK